MANSCYFQIKVKGADKSNVERFIDILNCTNKEYCFKGIYGVDCIDTGKESDDLNIYQDSDGNYATIYQGDCKWSVKSAMRESELPEDRIIIDNLKLTSIEELSKELKLNVEVYSEEHGYEFAEHCIIEQGEVTVDEEIYFTEICRDIEESWETWLETNKNNIDNIIKNSDLTIEDIKEAFNNSEAENLNYVTIGGYGYFEFII